MASGEQTTDVALVFENAVRQVIAHCRIVALRIAKEGGSADDVAEALLGAAGLPSLALTEFRVREQGILDAVEEACRLYEAGEFTDPGRAMDAVRDALKRRG